VQPSNVVYKFLVDTGSTVSLIPFSLVKPFEKNISLNNLFAANGSCIQTFGSLNLDLQLNEKIYNWTFIIAKVNNPILGADFLTFYNMLVDCKNKRIFNLGDHHEIKLEKNLSNRIGTISIKNYKEEISKSKIFFNSGKQKFKTTILTLRDHQNLLNKSSKIKTVISDNPRTIKEVSDEVIGEQSSVTVSVIADSKDTNHHRSEVQDIIYLEKINNQPLKKLIDDFIKIEDSEGMKLTGVKTEHQICTTGRPTHAKIRQLPPEKLQAAKEIFNELLKKNSVSVELRLGLAFNDG